MYLIAKVDGLICSYCLNCFDKIMHISHIGIDISESELFNN